MGGQCLFCPEVPCPSHKTEAGDGQSREPSRPCWKEQLSLTCPAVGSAAGKVWLAPGPSWAWFGEALSDRVSHLPVQGRRWRRRRPSPQRP